jgi:hypothetical protein
MLSLKKFGININLTPAYDWKMFKSSDIALGTVTRDGSAISRFTLRGVHYTVVDTLGSGAYGTTYKVHCGVDGRDYAIKYILKGLTTQKDLQIFLKECVIQILLAEESKGEAGGPFVPTLYEIGFNPFTFEGFIRSELMHNSFQNIVNALTPEQNDILIPDALKQIASHLKFFGERLAFNHRDLKGDNIMYRRLGEGHRQFCLIDFGLSCLTWNGLKISGGDYFSASATCYKKDRDLCQFVYYIVNFSPITDKLRAELVKFLLVRLKKTEVKLYEALGEWLDIYDYLDRSNVEAPTEPNVVIRSMRKFLGEEVPEPPKICPPGEVYNPETKRCVAIGGPAAAAVEAAIAGPADCPSGKVRNPKTGRCVKADGWAGKRALAALAMAPANVAPLELPAAAAVDCPPGKIRNPKTRRCVKIDGWAGRRAARGFIAPALAPIGAHASAAAEKPCPPEKIYNPKTRRCVKRTGWAGKRVLAGD